VANPMEQFEIKSIFPVVEHGQELPWYALTNSSLWMLIALVVVSAFMLISTSKMAIVPGRMQAAVESMYGFISDMMHENIGPEGKRYIPLVFSLFIFVLAANLLGLIPWVHAFTPTSHIAVTFALAAIVFIVVLAVGFMRHGLHFFALFIPKGVPWYIAWFVVIIEFMSFLSRPFTLAIRLFANMTAGHVLMKVFGGFVVSLGAAGGIVAFASILPMVTNIALTALELLIAVVQAYVFALLTSIYLNDAVNLH
jgi:F-type H+-transporting ATPase subunit a